MLKQRQRFFQLVVSHPDFSKDEDLQKVLKEDNLAVRSKVKKGLRTSLYHELWMISGIIVTRILMKNFRRKEILWRSTHHLPRRHMGILFQKKRDFVEEYTPLTKETYGNFTKMVNSQQYVALAVDNFSSGIMTASAGDDNSTKELKGIFVTFSSALNGVKESLDVMSTNDDNTLGFTLELYSRYMDAAN
ncbi:uncharacterized protein [Pocillopora verrucosa]|uniref:uncharacterized protein n=1 Tax=Pocillopora verrucosa TaxID=203993 RepID=UPI0033404B5D